MTVKPDEIKIPVLGATLTEMPVIPDYGHLTQPSTRVLRSLILCVLEGIPPFLVFPVLTLFFGPAIHGPSLLLIFFFKIPSPQRSCPLTPSPQRRPLATHHSSRWDLASCGAQTCSCCPSPGMSPHYSSLHP